MAMSKYAWRPLPEVMAQLQSRRQTQLHLDEQHLRSPIPTYVPVSPCLPLPRHFIDAAPPAVRIPSRPRTPSPNPPQPPA